MADPFRYLFNDVTQRYVFYFWSGEQTTANHLKVLILVLPVIFLFAGLVIRQIRSTPAFRVLAPCVLISYCGIALLDAFKWPYYMLHFFVFISAVVAITAAQLRFTRMRLAAAAGVAALMLVEIGGLGAKMRTNQYGRQFVPTIEYVRSNAAAARYIEGDLTLNFGLGYDNPHFHMDDRLGYYTGVKPSLIVSGQFDDFGYIHNHEPDVYRFIVHRLDTEYRLVAQFGDYKIYQPR